MSKTRQSQLRSLSARFSPGHLVDWHSHSWSQLVYASEGVLTVETQEGCWVVPPRRAIWVPAGRCHRLQMHGRVCLQTIYLKVDLQSYGLPDCAVVNISPLVHELILHVCERGIVNGDCVENRSLIQFLTSQLQKLSALPLVVTMPRDARAQRVARRILEAHGAIYSLQDLCQTCGTSLRTMQRIFRDEVGLPLARWQHQVKMMRAVQLLEEQQSVTHVAFELGFESVSGFIQSFRNSFGESPGKYRTQ
jgi:AraC-like DNA-binding protein